MAAQVLIAVISSVLFIITHAFPSQDGNVKCISDSDCFYQNQICLDYRCQCKLGHIPYIHHCFKIRQHGQECSISEQCVDFRMTCNVTVGDTLKINRCICDSFHEWNPYTNECEQARNFSAIVGTLGEKYKWAENIAAAGKRVFSGFLIAGLLVILLGFTFAAFCVIYGCCFRDVIQGPYSKSEKTDLEKLTAQQVASSGSPKEGTYMVMEQAALAAFK